MPSIPLPQFLVGLWPTIKGRILSLLMSDKVRPFIWLYYVPLGIWGIYGTFFSAPITFVRPEMGQTIYNAWIWLHMVGPLIVMCGMRFEDLSKTGKLGYWGIGMQSGGHCGMFFVLAAYEMSALAAASVTPVIMYSCFALSPYVIGCLLLTMQAIIKRRMIEYIQRDLAYHKALEDDK